MNKANLSPAGAGASLSLAKIILLFLSRLYILIQEGFPISKANIYQYVKEFKKRGDIN